MVIKILLDQNSPLVFATALMLADFILCLSL